MTKVAPRLVFAYEFDKKAAYEAEGRGYLSCAHVELPDGSQYPVVFYDLVRLQQDLEEEVAGGNPFVAEPGMIVVPSVTLENMEKAVSKLYREGFFSSFQHQRRREQGARGLTRGCGVIEATEAMLKAPARVLRTYDSATWDLLVRHVLDSLVAWLGYQVTVESLEQACIGDGFCLDVLRACPTDNELVHWKGILGASIVDDFLRVTLVVFFYSGNQRLVTTKGMEFAEYEYEANEVTGGTWRLSGWFEDTLGEYSSF